LIDFEKDKWPKLREECAKIHPENPQFEKKAVRDLKVVPLAKKELKRMQTRDLVKMRDQLHQ
jgi:hypothetical protein